MVHNHYSSPFLSTIPEPTIPLNLRSFSLEVGRLGAPATLRMPSLLLTSLEGLGQLFTSLESLPSRPDGPNGASGAQVFGDELHGGFPWWKTMIFFQEKHQTTIVHGKCPGFEWCFSHSSNGKKSYKFRSRKLGFQCSLKWEKHICKRRIVPPCFAVPVRVFVAGHHGSFRTSGSRQTRNGVYQTHQKMI